MQIVEIRARSNGSHRNQTFNGVLPKGWAMIPENLATKNFPFGDLTVEGDNGIPTVTAWVPGVVPEPEMPEEPDDEITAAQLAAAIQEGVDSV